MHHMTKMDERFKKKKSLQDNISYLSLHANHIECFPFELKFADICPARVRHYKWIVTSETFNVTTSCQQSGISERER